LLSMHLDGRASSGNIKLRAGKNYKAKVKVKDPDGDSLSYRWELRLESQATQEGGDREAIPDLLPGLINATTDHEIALPAPREPGAYRLFVYALDGRGKAAHANLPFYVSSP